MLLTTSIYGLFEISNKQLISFQEIHLLHSECAILGVRKIWLTFTLIQVM